MNNKMHDLNASGKREKPLSLYLDIVLALCAAFALTLDMNVRSGNNYVNWSASLPDTPVVTTLFAAVLFVRRKANSSLSRSGAGMWILSAFLGFWWVLALSVVNTMDINQPFLSSGQMLKTAVVTIGMAGLYELLFRALAFALEKGDAWRPRSLSDKGFVCRIAAVYDKHTFLFCTSIILLAWLPHMVIAYPCAMNNDSVTQLREWVGIYQFSSHHPPFGTLLIGLCYNAGLKLGDGAMGLALYAFLQAFLASVVMGYLQQVLRRIDTPFWLRVFTLFMVCVCPVYVDNVSTIIKDIPYTYGMLLMLCEIALCLFAREKMTWPGMLRLVAGGMFVMLMRNNGKYILLPLTACMAVWTVKKPKARAGALCALVISIVVSMGVDAWLMNTYEIVPGSRKEALSLPFQQTARFVRDHEEEIPQEEQDAIEAVLGMSALGKAYDPMVSDPVKGRYRSDVTNEDLMRYFSVWMKQFFRDPVCYVKATLIQNVLLFDPQTQNLALFSGTGLDTETKAQLNIKETGTFDGIRRTKDNLRRMLLSLPGMAQFNSVGFHCCVLLFVCLWSMKKRLKNMIILLLPMVISMLVIIAGPCIQNQDRYGFPIIYCMPLILACLSHELKKTNKKEVNV